MDTADWCCRKPLVPLLNARSTGSNAPRPRDLLTPKFDEQHTQAKPRQTQLTMQAGQRAASFHCSRTAHVAYTHSIARICSNLSTSLTAAEARRPQVRKSSVFVFSSQQSESAWPRRHSIEAHRRLFSKPMVIVVQHAQAHAGRVTHTEPRLVQSQEYNMWRNRCFAALTKHAVK